MRFVVSRLSAVILAAACWGPAGCKQRDLLPPPTPQVHQTQTGGKAPTSLAAGGEVVLALWNVENLFDDQDDPDNHDTDEDWFAHDPAALAQKIDHLSEAISRMNDGRGPDILAMNEVESERVVERLRDAVNARFDSAGRGDLKYDHIIFRPDRTGRRFAPAILTRLPVEQDRTRKLGGHKNGRILEGHIVVNGHELTLIVAHWTSRLDRGGSNNADRRASYADDCYGRFRAIVTANPDADVIVCGDFNAEPHDTSVTGNLHAAADEGTVTAAGPGFPRLLNATARIDTRKEGTIKYGGRWQVFDNICLSKGMLDNRGWTANPGDTAVFNPSWMLTTSDRKPFRFGGRDWKGPRGYADHLPVTIKLKVAGG